VLIVLMMDFGANYFANNNNGGFAKGEPTSDGSVKWNSATGSYE